MDRLVIGGPTLANVPASFALDLAQLFVCTREQGPWPSMSMGFIHSTYVHVGREKILAGALERQASHILWIDTDMAFPPDAAIRLAAHERPVVACNCVMKNPRQMFTARRDGEPVATTEQSSGLEAVDSVGMAVMLMRTDVVAGWDRPWFMHGVNSDGEDIGEDVMFCRRLREAGHTIYIDHDLSKEIGHIGPYIFRPDVDHAALAV
jgi:hypothetical protein